LVIIAGTSWTLAAAKRFHHRLSRVVFSVCRRLSRLSCFILRPPPSARTRLGVNVFSSVVCFPHDGLYHPCATISQRLLALLAGSLFKRAGVSCRRRSPLSVSCGSFAVNSGVSEVISRAVPVPLPTDVTGEKRGTFEGRRWR
jgi:hypothetical protein